jgi:hypothetical protein
MSAIGRAFVGQHQAAGDGLRNFHLFDPYRNPSSGVKSARQTFRGTPVIPLVILMFRKKNGGISVVAKKRFAIGTFF